MVIRKKRYEELENRIIKLEDTLKNLNEYLDNTNKHLEEERKIANLNRDKISEFISNTPKII